MAARLGPVSDLPESVATPGYVPEEQGTGIVHIGLGAFHKAHQAVYTDTALAAAGGDWRIIGVSLRSAGISDELRPQHCRYTLIERGAEGTTARVIGSVAAALSLQSHRAEVLAALTAPSTRIVSLTVTEKGYGIDRATGGVDRAHAAIAHDLAQPEEPVGVAGLIVWALAQRHAKGAAPFTVLCCDNLPENGAMLRGLILDFARHTCPHVVSHIRDTVAFPGTMVDRITPASTEATLALAHRLTGYEDFAAVETEAFTQWVIEDNFPNGRPEWAAAGALLVPEVGAYENMKLRMLNGTHSMLAYAGFLSGRRYARDVMADPEFDRLVRRHLRTAAQTLKPLPGVNLERYAEALVHRFSNPHLDHETYQIAMDGTEKLPQRILAPALEAASDHRSTEAFCFATAVWMRYAMGRLDSGETYALRDPQEAAIASVLEGKRSAKEIATALFGLGEMFPSALLGDAGWTDSVVAKLDLMLSVGTKAMIAREAASL